MTAPPRAGKPRAMWQDWSIVTEVPSLRLAPLSVEDADAYYALLDRNRAHLTQRGGGEGVSQTGQPGLKIDPVGRQ